MPIPNYIYLPTIYIYRNAASDIHLTPSHSCTFHPFSPLQGQLFVGAQGPQSLGLRGSFQQLRCGVPSGRHPGHAFHGGWRPRAAVHDLFVSQSKGHVSGRAIHTENGGKLMGNFVRYGCQGAIGYDVLSGRTEVDTTPPWHPTQATHSR